MADEVPNLCSPKAVAELLRRHGIQPSKALGQNFLIDRNVLRQIVKAGGVGEGTRVLEVGPGLGVLTEELLAAGAFVTSVEKDDHLWPVLEERFAGRPAFELVKGDALDLDYGAFLSERGITHLVANLPYSVGTRVVVEAATCAAPPRQMTLLLQKEVCQRFAAPVRSPDRGAVSVWLQRCYDVSLVRDVPPGCFVPRPDVVSTVVSLARHDRFPLSADEDRRFRALVKTAFLHRRKQLAASMKSAGDFALPAPRIRELLESVGAEPTARAEELSVEQWLHLAAAWQPAP